MGVGPEMHIKGPNHIDAIVGRNIRIYRQKLRISQTDLGNQIGVSFQQVQKYENGKNRVGASRLAQIAMALDVPIPALFAGVEKGSTDKNKSFDLLSDRNSIKLSEAFAEISNPQLRRCIVDLITRIAQIPNKGSGA